MKITLPPSLIHQYAVVVTVNLGVLTTGMSLAWPSPVLVKLRNETETPLPRPITDEEGSWIVAGGFTLAWFTNILGGMLLDIIGRKYCLLLISLPKCVAALLFVFATEVWMLIFGRVLMSALDCFLFVAVPIYSSEIASKEQRGSLGTFLQIFSCMGIVTTLAVGPFLSYKVFNIVFATAIVISTMPILCLPESPFYLYSKGRIDEALEILKQIRFNESAAQQELQEYKQSTDKSEEKIDEISIFRNKIFIKSLLLGVILNAGSQLIGFNAVQFYLQTILESTKTSVKPELASVIIGIIQVFASFCTPFILTRYGRKPVLIISLSGMFLGMIGLGTFFKITESENYDITGFMNFLPIISLILVIYCYSVGIGSLVWLVTAELFEGPARALGVSICSVTSTISIFIITKYFILMTTALGPAWTYWVFSMVCVTVSALIAMFLPETKGKTYREIQEALGADVIKEEDVKDNV